VAGANSKDCVLTLVERKTGLVLIGKLPDRTARSLSRRAVSLMRRHGGAFETVTADNVLPTKSKLSAETESSRAWCSPLSPNF
jgi:IS30 family transposase